MTLDTYDYVMADLDGSERVPAKPRSVRHERLMCPFCVRLTPTRTQCFPEPAFGTRTETFSVQVNTRPTRTPRLGRSRTRGVCTVMFPAWPPGFNVYPPPGGLLRRHVCGPSHSEYRRS
jgi:hypothetical protein